VLSVGFTPGAFDFGGRQLEPIPYLLECRCCAVGGWMH
jgi:hypothetical protein